MKFPNPFDRGEQSREPQQEERPSETPCEHLQLYPRWDSVEDMGDPKKVTGYRCGLCGASFSRQEGDTLDRRTKAIKL